MLEDASDEMPKTGKLQGRHHVFPTDDYENALIAATWFTKSYPKRRGPSRHHQELINSGSEINLDSIKGKVLKLERLYTQCMDGAKREWDT